MRVIVFDTETTGLPKNKNISPSEHSYWPYIVQLSWLMYDDATKQLISTYKGY